MFICLLSNLQVGEAKKKFGSAPRRLFSRSERLSSLSRSSNEIAGRSPLANFSINQSRRKSYRSKAAIRYIARNFITSRIARSRVTQEMIDRQADISLHSALLAQSAKQLLHHVAPTIVSMYFCRRIEISRGDIFFYFSDTRNVQKFIPEVGLMLQHIGVSVNIFLTYLLKSVHILI